MDRFNILLEAYKKLFDVNDDLKKELNDISINEHNKNLDDLIVLRAKEASSLSEKDYNEHINFINELNKDPHCITELEIMYSFIYD